MWIIGEQKTYRDKRDRTADFLDAMAAGHGQYEYR